MMLPNEEISRGGAWEMAARLSEKTGVVHDVCDICFAVIPKRLGRSIKRRQKDWTYAEVLFMCEGCAKAM